MPGDWIAQWPAFIAAALILHAPGFAVFAALRIRGFALWALAPLGSTAVLAVVAVVVAKFGFGWTLLSAGVGCVIAFVLAAIVGLALRPAWLPPRRSRGSWILAAGLAIAVVVGGLRLCFYIGAPEAISQTNDAVFHLNAVRYVLETGSASSVDLTGVLGSSSVYPAAWHAITSLVVLASGASIPVAANMVSLIIAITVWPFGLAWMTRVATRSTSIAAIAAALSPLSLAFPMLMFEWGVLYPYALAVAMLPALIGATLCAPVWIGAGRGRVRRTVAVVLVVFVGLVAVSLSQPAALLGWLVCAVVWFTWHVVGVLHAGSSRALAWGLSLAAVWIAAAAVWVILTRSTGGSHWAPFSGKLEAVLAVLLNGPVLLPYAVGISILMIAGLIVSFRRQDLRWIATSWVILAGLYVVAAAIGQPLLRDALVNAWYADPYRLAALLPLVVLPLAAIGLHAILAWLQGALSAIPDGGPADKRATAWALGAVAAIGLVALVVVPVVPMPRVIERTPDSESRYASDESSYLSPDERALLSDLGSLVPDGTRIIGNPSTGTGFGYMLSGADVYPRTWSPPSTPEWAVLAEGMNRAAEDPAVCEALDAFGSPGYVLDFGPGEPGPGRYVMPGMTAFKGSEGFELVDTRGDASLWRVTACG